MSWDDLVGTPWLEGGRDLDGLDCYGVVLLGLERLGIPMLDVWESWQAKYANGWREYDQAVPEGWAWHDPDEELLPRAGDVVVTRDRGIPRHLGLRVEDRHGRPQVLTAVEAWGVVLVGDALGTRHLEGIVRRVDA